MISITIEMVRKINIRCITMLYGVYKYITFIPTICTQLTAVPVALDMNSAKVSSAIASRLHKVKITLRQDYIEQA